jgi:hypothetical protein
LRYPAATGVWSGRALKNFPHQVNDLGKLTAALNVANMLGGAGKPIGDDGVFGEALAHAGVYTFRNKTLSVAANIKEEKTKPVGSQGFRTAARDIRRFFMLADLMTPAYGLTQRAHEILAASGNVSLRNALWRDAMLQLRLTDANGNTSHPYRIMRRLLADRPGIETSKLLLALEARDDSPAEYVRISALANLSVPAIISAIGIGESNARNATKILPGIGEQVGDVFRGANHSYLAKHAIATEDSIIEEGSDEYEKSEPSTPIEVKAEDISSVPSFSATPPTNVDLAAAIEIRKRRTIEHHKAVIGLAKIIASNGYTLYESPYDCLGFKKKTGALLIEMKTLDGTRADERRQSERALGQLSGYRFFNVQEKMKIPKLQEIVAYTAKPNDDTVHFMRDNAVCSVWPTGADWMSADLEGNIAKLSPDDLLAD